MDTIGNRMLNTGSVSSIVRCTTRLLYFIYYVLIHILFPICIHIYILYIYSYIHIFIYANVNTGSICLYIVGGDIYVLATHADWGRASTAAPTCHLEPPTTHM